MGDTIEVRLKNSLSQATTIHWHGVRVPAEMDGTEAVQSPVGPGETFEYRFVVPDAGTYWYHSHTNETEQLERGLYGALIVREPSEPEFDAERILHLDDLKLGPDGDLAPFGGEHEHHAGREGDVRLLNGRQEPDLSMPGGTVERWRIIDTANTRFVRLSLGGRPFTIIGTDGGLLPQPVTAAEVLLTPGERVDLAVGPFEEGERIEIEALPYDRGKGETPRERFATLQVGPATASSAHIPELFRHIDPLVERRRGAESDGQPEGAHARRASPARRSCSGRRTSGVGSRQRNGAGSSVPPPRLLLPGRRGRRQGAARCRAWKDTVNVPRKSQTADCVASRMIDRASGCTTATSSSTMRWG